MLMRGFTKAAGLDIYVAEDMVIIPQDRKPISIRIQIKLFTQTYGRIAPWSRLSVKSINIVADIIN